jgi:hypothetical protein
LGFESLRDASQAFRCTRAVDEHQDLAHARPVDERKQLAWPRALSPVSIGGQPSGAAAAA